MRTSKKFLIVALTLVAGLVFTNCEEEKGCTDPLALNYDPTAGTDNGTCIYDVTPGNSRLTFTFTHNFDGDPVSNNTFNLFDHITEDGDTISITRLRYMISDIRLYTPGGDSVMIEGYQLVDVTAGTGLVYEPMVEVPHGIYTGLSFVFGMDEEDNISNAYTDLNAATWNWPPMLGGGYHFMQMEGRYKVQGTDSLYAYHMGTARVSPDVFEQNYFIADLDGLALAKQYADIEIEMNIAEWYRNPHTWDLNAFNAPLMPVYAAQKMMQDNGKTVFSLGEITHTD